MSLPQRILGTLKRVAVLGLTGLPVSGCVTDFVAPLAVATHRYPSVKRAVAVTPPTRAQQLADDEDVARDRLPSAREIFDLHPKGSDPEKMRQPFILNPHEGPLKISSLSRDDAAAADTIRSRQSETAARMAMLRPVPPAPTTQGTTARPVATSLGHQ